MNAIPVLMMKTSDVKPTADVSPTASSIQLRIVSMVCVLLRITVTPRSEHDGDGCPDEVAEATADVSGDVPSR